MKNLFLVFFTFLTFSTFAQNNELTYSLQPIEDDYFGKGIAFSYFRNITPRQSIGLRTNLTSKDYKYTPNSLHSGSIDLVNRWNLLKQQKFRLMGEFGVSALRIHEPSESYILFCGVVEPGTFLPHSIPEMNWLMKEAEDDLFLILMRV